MLKIPFSPRMFETGLCNLNRNAFFNPSRILGPDDRIYNDLVLQTMLIVGTQSTCVLDAGSFFGSMAFAVEDLLRKANYDYKRISWHLLDNNLYVNELKESLENDNPISGRYLHQFNVDDWKKHPRPELFSLGSKGHCVPPTTTTEFEQYWKNLAVSYNVPMPDMSMAIDTNSIAADKFDIIMFDLSAGKYNENLEVLNNLLIKTHDKTVIVLDDVVPQHPETMALFKTLYDTLSYRPIAFSTYKVALAKESSKDAIIENLRDYIDTSYGTKGYYWCREVTGSVWGNYLELKTRA